MEKEGNDSRPNKGEDLELAHQTKFHCADCGNLRLIRTKILHIGKLWERIYMPSQVVGMASMLCGYPGLGLYKRGISRRTMLGPPSLKKMVTKDQQETTGIHVVLPHTEVSLLPGNSVARQAWDG
ncbi:hypothetical protein TURU_004995 [Turdus rufiventris]|nr:hypothetical protein TURU_004995 [Turdus rufiventris]